MNSPIKLPPPSFYQKHEDVCGDEVGPPTPFWNQAAVEQAVRLYIEVLERIASEEFVSLGEGNVDVRPTLSDRDACDLARATLLGIQEEAPMSKLNPPPYPTPHPVTGYRMFSASQVEAHVNRMVRQALTEAANICAEEGLEWDSGAVVLYKNYAEHCAHRIRGMIQDIRDE